MRKPQWKIRMISWPTPQKVYVTVNEDRLEDGRILPRVITWEDGARYEIDRVIETCKAASAKAGGAGLRFTIRIGRKNAFLWLEDDCKGGGRYFVERRRAKSA
jgi:hypothetical protein